MKASLHLLIITIVSGFFLNSCSILGLKRVIVDKQAISFLAFGNSGYHYRYLTPDKDRPPLTKKQFILKEKQSWRDAHLDETRFKSKPHSKLRRTGGIVETSGVKPAAEGMQQYCHKVECEFAIMLGDNMLPYGATENKEANKMRFKLQLEKPYEALAEDRPNFKIHAAYGDRDWHTSRLSRKLQLEHTLKESSIVSMEQPGYYRFKQGDADFFVLDTNLLLAATIVYQSKLNPNGSEIKSSEVDVPKAWKLPNSEERQQLAWLESGLKNSSAKWKIVFGHHSPWSSSGNNFEQSRALRQLIMPLLCEYADLYFSAQENLLEVHQDTCENQQQHDDNPLTTIVSGAAAQQSPINHQFRQWQNKHYGQHIELWSKDMIWGFTYVRLLDDVAEITMLSISDDRKNRPVTEKTLRFKRRTGTEF